MGKEEGAYRAHVMVLPFPGQGHLNPMLQFSKRLASKGIKITVATTLSTTQTLPAQVGSITIQPIYDDLTEGGPKGSGGLMGFIERFEGCYFQHLPNIFKKHEMSKNLIKCLVYDANLPKSLEIAKQLGIPAAALFTQSCSAVVGYLQMAQDYSIESTKAMPLLKSPSSVVASLDSARFLNTLKYLLSSFSNLDQADWVLFNS